MIKCSVGIMAYNEEANIGRLLDRLTVQKTKLVKVEEIIVVASGCTDKTTEVVLDKCKKNKQIKLLLEKKRQGKASAINLFIKHTTSPVLVMISADTLPAPDALEKLVIPLADQKVGVTGAQVVPVNNPHHFMGFYVHCFWKLHHEIGQRFFKAGELIAWRNVIAGINPQTATDETNIAALVFEKGYRGVYAAGAKVYNKGPETVSDFLKVRRRHLAAYYHLKEEAKLSYIPDTMNNFLVLKLFFQVIKPQNLSELLWIGGVIILEIAGRLLAWYDWRIKKEAHTVWSMALSTKSLP